MPKPTVLETKTLAETKIFKISDLHLRFSNGKEVHFEKAQVKKPGAVMIVPLLDDETFLLIREYAAAADAYTLGFPKGAIDHVDDKVLETANKELMEETGYGANELTHVTELSLSPAYFNNMMQIVLAKDLYPKKLEGDEPEPIEVVPWKWKDIDKLLAHPEFTESRGVAALLLVERMLKS